MKPRKTLVFASLALASLGSLSAWAQLPVRISVPKINKPKPEAPPPPPGDAAAPARETQGPATANSTPAASAPATPPTVAPVSPYEPGDSTIAKDSVQVTAHTFNVYRKNFDVWSWVPRLEFRMNGPIPSGSQLYAEFAIPGGQPLKFDCPTAETQKGYWRNTQCGANDIPEDKGTIYTGVVNFTIRMRNELAGTDSTLFAGRMKVAKVRSNEHGPKFVNHFVYFIDHDWNMPIGYVYFTPDSVRGMDLPTLNLAFWVRGDPGNFEPHLFYQGKEVGKIIWQGQEVGRASCGAETENGTTHYVEDSFPQKARWARIRCTLVNVKGWDRTGQAPGIFGPQYSLNANPGEYELKVLRQNQLARSIKFTVASDGNPDFGIAKANNLGTRRAIVPVQILGAQDGTWDRTAWKSESFYGNPLQGFTPVP